MAVNFILGDCMDLMRSKPMGYYHLAVVDPPYGISVCSMNLGATKDSKPRKFEMGDWDNNVPPPEYWKELFRVSRNQIVWGANYFFDDLKSTDCCFIWDKEQPEGLSFADFELAWTSFKMPCRKIRRSRGKDRSDDKRHPTQKPIYLYESCFLLWSEYLGKNVNGMRVLDTHGGSHNSAIAAFRNGLEMDICEINESYHKSGKSAFDEATKQQMLF